MTANPLVAAADTTVAGFLAAPAFHYCHSAFPVTGVTPWGADCIWGASHPVPTGRPRLWPRGEAGGSMEGRE